MRVGSGAVEEGEEGALGAWEGGGEVARVGGGAEVGEEGEEGGCVAVAFSAEWGARRKC